MKVAVRVKISLPAGPKPGENYLDIARNHGFDWVDISAWPRTECWNAGIASGKY
jgi:hypothetical protein